jgi:hypothetical protein
MSEKLAGHKTTVYVHMFNSCFHLEPACQDRDILEVNLCTPHYQKYKNYETLQSCYICDKTTSNKRSVIMPISKIDLFSVYLNQELKVEKDASAGKVILCFTCYRNFNKFVRSDDSLNELSKTDDYQLTKCFHSLIRWNNAISDWERQGQWAV